MPGSSGLLAQNPTPSSRGPDSSEGGGEEGATRRIRGAAFKPVPETPASHLRSTEASIMTGYDRGIGGDLPSTAPVSTLQVSVGVDLNAEDMMDVFVHQPILIAVHDGGTSLIGNSNFAPPSSADCRFFVYKHCSSISEKDTM